MNMFQLQHYRDQLHYEPENEFYFLHYIYHALNWIHGNKILSASAEQIINETTQFHVAKVEDETLLQENLLRGALFMHVAGMLCELFMMVIPFTDKLILDERHFAMLQRRKCCLMFPFYTNTRDEWREELEKSYSERFVKEAYCWRTKT